MVNLASSAYDLRRKRCWTGIELRAIGRILVAGDDLPSLALKLLPVCCLTIAVAYDEDAPLCCEVRLTCLKAADHRRRNIGVTLKRRFVVVTGVALKKDLAILRQPISYA
jgi:hypothetical protein